MLNKKCTAAAENSQARPQVTGAFLRGPGATSCRSGWELVTLPPAGLGAWPDSSGPGCPCPRHRRAVAARRVLSRPPLFNQLLTLPFPMAAAVGGLGESPFEDALDKFLVSAALQHARASSTTAPHVSPRPLLAAASLQLARGGPGVTQQAGRQYSTFRRAARAPFSSPPGAAASLTHAASLARLQFNHSGADFLQVRSHLVPGLLPPGSRPSPPGAGPTRVPQPRPGARTPSLTQFPAPAPPAAPRGRLAASTAPPKRPRCGERRQTRAA